MGAGTDVLAQVDAPEFSAVKFQTIDDNVAGIAIVRVVMGIRRIPFQEQLILSVAIHIAHRTVVGPVLIGASVWCVAAFRTVEWDRAIEVLPRGDIVRCKRAGS